MEKAFIIALCLFLLRAALFPYPLRKYVRLCLFFFDKVTKNVRKGLLFILTLNYNVSK